MPEFTNDLTHDDLALLLLLAEKRSLTRSAMTLAWSTPKASHRLNHARALIGDELFVRSGNSLVPTKRMEALVPTMRRALEALEGIFAEERFSPLEIDRTIIFEMVDNAAAVLLAPALPRTDRTAPKLKSGFARLLGSPSRISGTAPQIWPSVLISTASFPATFSPPRFLRAGMSPSCAAAIPC